jgi:hypothetical protein
MYKYVMGRVEKDVEGQKLFMMREYTERERESMSEGLGRFLQRKNYTAEWIGNMGEDI